MHAGNIALSACLGAAFWLAAPASPARALVNHVIGDSVTANDANGVVWTDLAFGATLDDHAVGGAASWDFLDWCNPDCFWAEGDADDIWWIMIGSNDLRLDPSTTGADYHASLLGLVDAIERQSGSTDVRLISSPYAWDVFDLDRADMRAFTDTQAVVDQLLCANEARVQCATDLRFDLTFPDYYAWDGIHLNEAGHGLVAEMIPEPTTAFLLAQGFALMAYSRGRSRRSVLHPTQVLRPSIQEPPR